jgi:hypothetical protein
MTDQNRDDIAQYQLDQFDDPGNGGQTFSSPAPRQQGVVIATAVTTDATTVTTDGAPKPTTTPPPATDPANNNTNAAVAPLHQTTPVGQVSLGTSASFSSSTPSHGSHLLDIHRRELDDIMRKIHDLEASVVNFMMSDGVRAELRELKAEKIRVMKAYQDLMISENALRAPSRQDAPPLPLPQQLPQPQHASLVTVTTTSDSTTHSNIEKGLAENAFSNLFTMGSSALKSPALHKFEVPIPHPTNPARILTVSLPALVMSILHGGALAISEFPSPYDPFFSKWSKPWSQRIHAATGSKDMSFDALKYCAFAKHNRILYELHSKRDPAQLTYLDTPENFPPYEREMVLLVYGELAKAIVTSKLILNGVAYNLDKFVRVPQAGWDAYHNALGTLIDTYVHSTADQWKLHKFTFTHRCELIEKYGKQQQSGRSQDHSTSQKQSKKDNTTQQHKKDRRRQERSQEHERFQQQAHVQPVLGDAPEGDPNKGKPVDPRTNARIPFPGLGTTPAEREWLAFRVGMCKVKDRYCEACFFRNWKHPFSHHTAGCNIFEAVSPFNTKPNVVLRK